MVVRGFAACVSRADTLDDHSEQAGCCSSHRHNKDFAALSFMSVRMISQASDQYTSFMQKQWAKVEELNAN